MRLFTRLLVVVLFSIAPSLGITAEDKAVAKKGEKMETLTVGGGCFWCVEAVFQQFNGVEKVVSGYAGGNDDSPTYEEVSSGNSGHAEVVQVTFNPSMITVDQLLTIFFHAHDPTTKNRQGADVGPQYRSVILFGSATQKEAAERIMKKITDDKVWGSTPLTTEVAPLKKFFSAEEYHQNYYNLNSSKPYCSFVIAPKIAKVRTDFKELLHKP